MAVARRSLIATLATPSLASATTEPALDVGGTIAPPSPRRLDLAALDSVASVPLTTRTPWTLGPQQFSGVPLRRLLGALGAAGPVLHAIALNDINAPVTITTGRALRDHGWPEGATTVVVMLDAGGAFEALDPKGLHIWWGAYVGMSEQILRSGPLADIAADIVATRASARAAHGWIMDIYLIRKS